MAVSARDFLVISQGAEGGWGYAPGQAAIVVATAAATLALGVGAAGSAAQAAALAWLRAGLGQAERVEIRGVPFDRLQRGYQRPPSA